MARDKTASEFDSSDDTRAICAVSLEASAVLGRAWMQVSQLLKVGRGAVIELDTGPSDQIDFCVNDKLVARGTVKVVDDRLAVEIMEIVKRGS